MSVQSASHVLSYFQLTWFTGTSVTNRHFRCLRAHVRVSWKLVNIREKLILALRICLLYKSLCIQVQVYNAISFCQVTVVPLVLLCLTTFFPTNFRTLFVWPSSMLKYSLAVLNGWLGHPQCCRSFLNYAPSKPFWRTVHLLSEWSPADVLQVVCSSSKKPLFPSNTTSLSR